MYLKRGLILLIAGGAIALISFSMLGYYTMQFINIIQQEGKNTIAPGSSINVQETINNTQGIGIYIVTFAELGGQASVMIVDSAGKTLVDRNINPPIAIESFNTDAPGIYNMNLLNPTNQVLEVAIGFGDQEDLLSRNDLFSTMAVQIFVSLIVVGIALTIAGGIITILDRKQINRMKQFGDTSDLI
jgi:hypothetical protein